MPNPANLEALLAHGPWLRRLAVALVDATSADDLVQETWLQTLRNPPSLERSPRPWLARVLRNARFMQQRSDRRREAREARVADASDSDADAPVDDVLARAQQLRIVSELVEDLDEPFRRAILLHFFEERTTADIAAAEGIAPSTARWRIKTGLERLRTTLDRRHDGDRRAWVAALAPGATAMKTTTKVLVLTTVLAASLGAVIVVTRSSAEPAKPDPRATATATAPKAAAIRRFEDRAARDRMVERIDQARRRREAAAESAARSVAPPPQPSRPSRPIEAPAPEDDPPSDPRDEARMQAWDTEIHEHLFPMLSECAAVAGGFKGDLGYEVKLVGEPDVGGVVEEVTVEGRNGTVLDPAIEECFREGAYTFELPPPTDGGYEIVALDVSLNLPGE